MVDDVRDRPSFKPLTREDVDDYALLPRRFDMLAGEVRALIEVLNRKVVPAVERIVGRLEDLERERTTADRAIGVLEDRLEILRMRMDGHK